MQDFFFISEEYILNVINLALIISMYMYIRTSGLFLRLVSWVSNLRPLGPLVLLYVSLHVFLYQICKGREPAMTSFDTDNRTVLDYIFYANNHGNSEEAMSPISVLDVPPISVWTKSLPPDLEFISDHLSLMAEF